MQSDCKMLNQKPTFLFQIGINSALHSSRILDQDEDSVVNGSRVEYMLK